MDATVEQLLSPTIAGRRRVLCCHSSVLSRRHGPNRLAGIAECVEANVPRLEFDAWVLADGEILLFHDDYLEPRSNGRGAVANRTRAELAGLRYVPGPGPVHFLDEAIPLLSGSPTLVQVDLKGTFPHTPQQSAALIRALEPIAGHVLIGSQAHWNLRPLAAAGYRVAFDTTFHLHRAPWAAGDNQAATRLSPHGTWDDSPLARLPGVSTPEYIRLRVADLHGLFPSVEWMVDWYTLFHLQDRGVALGDELARYGVALAAWTLRDEGEARSIEMLRRLFGLGAETIITEAPLALGGYLRVAGW